MIDKQKQTGGFDVFPLSVNYVNTTNGLDLFTFPQLAELVFTTNTYVSPYDYNYYNNYNSFPTYTTITTTSPVMPVYAQSYPVSPSYFLNSPAYNDYFNENSAYGQVRKEYRRLKNKEELYGLSHSEKKEKKSLKKQLKYL